VAANNIRTSRRKARHRGATPARNVPLLTLILAVALFAAGIPAVCVVRGQDASGKDSASQEIDLPKAATGEKEIELVDQLYPETGDQELRRQALERAVEYFPGDRATEFRAGVRLAILDWNSGRAARAHDRLAKILAGNSGRIGRSAYSWAEIVDGRILADIGRTSDALVLLDRVALDNSLPPERCAEAASAAADLRAIKSPQAALDWLEEAESQGGLSGPSLEAGIARLLLLTGHGDELDQRIADISADSSRGEATLAAILESGLRWNSPGDSARLATLVNAVAKARPTPGEELQKAIANCRTNSAAIAIQVRLTELLGAKPLSDWYHGMASDRRTGLDDFAKAIDQASRKSDPERCLRLSLRALASHGADETFLRRIWEAAGFADWVERAKPGKIDARVCPLLLDLCDRFPPTSPYFVEGKFLRAERLARNGDLAGQRTVLTEILAVPGLSANYLSPACRLLGANLEAAGLYRQALEVYAQAEPIVGSHTAGAQCVLRAAWINLGLGNNAEAERLIKILSGAPPAVTRQMSGVAQLAELETLVKIGRAEECWNAGRTWWAEWSKIAVELGAPTDLPEYAVPVIPDVAGLEDAVRRSAQAGDQTAYMRQLSILMAAARWQPSLCPEAAALCAAAVKSTPASADDLRGFLIRMLASPHPPEIAGLRERKLCLAVNYLDVHQYAEVLRIAADFAAVKQPEDNTTRAMHRVRALAALSAGGDLTGSVADLETDLSDPGASVQRAMAVGLLSDIYEKLDRGADSTKLLQREMDNPAVAADEQGLASLRSRLSLHSRSAVRAPDVARWIQSAHLKWYDYAEPKALDDPRLANLEDAIANSEKNFAPAEQAKLLLLAAGDARRPPGDRNRSFLEAAASIVGWASDYGSMEGLAATVINDPSFDTQTRLGLLWKILTVLARDARKADYDQWRGNDLCGSLSPDFKLRLAWLDREAALDRGSPKEILGLADALGAQELTASGTLIMQDCLDFLLRIGAISEAEALEKEAPSWKFSGDAAPSADAVRLEFARRVRIAMSINPIHEALASVALAQFHDVPESMPIDYTNLRIESRMPSRSPDATFRACLRLIADRQFERNDFQFWGTFLQALPDGSATAAGSLIRAGIASAANDDLRSQLIVLFFSSLNVDDPAVRGEMEREFALYRKPTDSPLSYTMIRLYEVHRDLRLGRPASLETAFLDLNDPRVVIVKQRACLRYYTQTGERVPLQKTIDQIDSAQLLSPGFLVQSVPALELLGGGAELKAARDASERLLREDVLDCWARGNEAAGDAALDLALVLGEKDSLPRAWVYGMESAAGNPLFQGRALLTQAYLESDWAQVARRAVSLTRSYPNRYSFYWYLGLALHHLGRDVEAAKALDLYLDHARDEPEYPKAVELAKSLAAPAPTGT
jgi:hypothetical protein